MAKNPAEVLSVAYEETMDRMFSGDADIAEIVHAAAKQGSTELVLDAEFLREMGIENVRLCQYSDAANQSGALDLSVKTTDEELALLAFLSPQGLTVQSEALFGNETALLYNPETMEQGFADSEWPDILMLDDEDVEEILDALETLKESFVSLGEQKTVPAEDVNAALARLEQQIASETVFTDGSTEVEYVTAAYTVNNASLRAFFDVLAESSEHDDVLEELEELLDELDEAVQLDASIKAYVNKKTGLVEKSVIEGSVVPVGVQEGRLDFGVTVTYAAGVIAVNAMLDNGEDDLEFKIELERMESDASLVYALDASVTQSGITIELICAEASYMRSSGEIVLMLQSEPLFGEEQLTVKGSIDKQEDAVTIAVTSIKAGSVSVAFDELRITFTEVATMPQPPADVRDVVSLSEEEVQSIIFNLMFGYAIPETPEWEY